MTMLNTPTRTPERQRLPQPVLFLIDDDAGVVHALRDDLSRRFGEDFRVIGDSSVAAGLATLASDNQWNGNVRQDMKRSEAV